jgi:membrane protein
VEVVLFSSIWSLFILKFNGIKKYLLKKRWVLLVVRVVNRLGIDNAGDMAAALSYYSLLSVFPLLIGVISVLGFIFPSELVQEELFTFFETNLPTSVVLLRENISAIIDMRTTLGILSLVGLFWSGGALFSSIGRTADRAWGIRTYRSYFFRKGRDLILAFGTGIVFFVSLGLTAVSTILPELVLPSGIAIATIFTHILAFILIFAVFLLINRYIPNTKIAWRDIWLGALLGAFVFEGINYIFSWYLTHFATYQMVYGSIASVIAFVVWIYCSSFNLIVGIELSAAHAAVNKEELQKE